MANLFVIFPLYRKLSVIKGSSHYSLKKTTRKIKNYFCKIPSRTYFRSKMFFTRYTETSRQFLLHQNCFQERK